MPRGKRPKETQLQTEESSPDRRGKKQNLGKETNQSETDNVQVPDAASISNEHILKIVESKMADMFTKQYEELKDKLLTVLAQQVSKLIAKVDIIEEEFVQFKEDHQCNPITIIENTPEQQAIQDKQARKTETLSRNITDMSNQLNEVRANVDATEQKLKENNIRLVGLPEWQFMEEGNTKTEIVKFSKEYLALDDISSEDIEEVTRLGKIKEDKPRDVLIKFRSKQKRNKFYSRRKNLYDANTRRSSSGIYLNEDLTPYRQRLFFDARNLRNKEVIHSVWTTTGTIMIKVEENSLPKPIMTHRDLADVLRENSNNDNKMTMNSAHDDQ